MRWIVTPAELGRHKVKTLKRKKKFHWRENDRRGKKAQGHWRLSQSLFETKFLSSFLLWKSSLRGYQGRSTFCPKSFDVRIIYLKHSVYTISFYSMKQLKKREITQKCLFIGFSYPAPPRFCPQTSWAFPREKLAEKKLRPEAKKAEHFRYRKNESSLMTKETLE